ncbi:MAG: transposase domain-containing protein [Bryobacteraceae bacterium]|jgi:hypothetical protein
MARTVAELPSGSGITGHISLGVITKTFSSAKIVTILEATAKSSVRQRDLPAHVVVYYVIALALYMQSSYREVLRCLLEGIQWLRDPSATNKVAGKSGISQARTPLSARNGFPVFQVPVGTPGFGPDEVRAAASREDLKAAREFLGPGR